MSKRSTELPEDIEVIGPGQMLAEAREKLKLSPKDVAQKLNFRVALVDEIEQEIFDKSLPDTFNRGYLKNYAKLVGVSEQDVLASYEMLGVADKQRTEMQSFSKITEKQALNNRVMWITYLILAALVASTAVYYIQDVNSKNATAKQSAAAEDNQTTEADSVNSTQLAEQGLQDESLIDETSLAVSEEPVISTVNSQENIEAANVVAVANQQVNSLPTEQAVQLNNDSLNEAVAVEAEQAPSESTAIFTFAGDCWVNIYDGNEERIAWGIKKAGYVMELKGTAPFRITVGKPELVSIDFNGVTVDMSKFNEGNIAKFTLPESS